MPEEIQRLQSQVRDQQREIERLKLKLAQGGGGSEDKVTAVQGLNVLVRKSSEELGRDGRRQLADTLSRRVAPGVVILGEPNGGTASLLVMVSPEAVGKVQAGRVIKELTAIGGGRGGGKPDLAEGGVPAEKLDETLASAPEVIERLLKVAS